MAIAVESFDGTYELDPHHSSFQFAVRHMNVSAFRGSFGDIDGRLTLDDGAITLEGQARAESVSITGPPEFRDHVVHGLDFFDADSHPLLSFRSTSVDLDQSGEATVSGDLTIRGASFPVSASGTYQPPTEDVYGAYRLGAALRTTVDRRNWGMTWQAPLPDGSDALGWEVDISVELEFMTTD